jgi:hypothetical protein
MLREKVEELLAGGAPEGWRVEPGYRLPDGSQEWEITPRAPVSEPAPILNYLVRVPPGGGMVLVLFGNTDAGVGGVHQLAPSARVLPAAEVDRLPELLRWVLRFDPPNRFGLT